MKLNFPLGQFLSRLLKSQNQPPVEILETKVLARGWSELCDYQFVQKDRYGESVILHREVYKRSAAVTVLPFDQQKQTVLLTKQLRLPVYIAGEDPYLLEACAGLIDPGETPLQAVAREAMEELGYQVFDYQLVAQGFSSPGNSTEFIYCYIAAYKSEDKKTTGGGIAAEGEDISVIEMPLRKFLYYLQEGKIHDVKTSLLGSLLALQRQSDVSHP